MIVDRLWQQFAAEAKKKTNRPNPTGSRLGACAASLEMLVFPELTRPEPWQPRSVANMSMGDQVEAWFSARIGQVFPDRWGLKGQTFYFPVPIDQGLVNAGALDKIAARLKTSDAYEPGRPNIFWGWPVEGFAPPRIRLAEGGRWGVRDIDPQKKYRPSVVLDVKPVRAELPEGLQDHDGPVVWLATYIDGVLADREKGRLTLVEAKSMSNWGFRRALMGTLEYRYRIQLMAGIVATRFPEALWILLRKETSHMAEVHFSREIEHVRVTLKAANGWEETFAVVDPVKMTLKPLGDEARRKRYAMLQAQWKRAPSDAEVEASMTQELPHDVLWDIAEAWTPYDIDFLPAVYERALRVLLAEPGQWHREYGPSFTCKKCGGAGGRACDPEDCVGGKTPKRGQDHKACAGTGRQACDKCEGGQLQVAELPAYPCGYAIPPETPVLMADYSWCPAGKLAPGDAIIAVDEFPSAERRCRKIRPAHVEAVAPRRKETVVIETARGTIRCSPEHPWLVAWRGSSGNRWQRADQIRPGHRLFWVGEPVATDTDSEAYMGGYVRGLAEGDGAIQGRRAATPTVRVAMADPEPLERLCWFLQYFGLRGDIRPFSAYTRRPMSQVTFGGVNRDPLGTTARLLGWPLDTREAACGYLAGIYDAEGHLEKWSLRIAQIASSPVVGRVLAAAEMVGADFGLERYGGSGLKGSLRFNSKRQTADLVRLFSRLRPAILRKADLTGWSTRNGWEPVTAVSTGPEMDLVDIQTSSKTFIAGGFITHNCPVVMHCYGPAKVERVIDTKPHYYVKRADYLASGLTFTPPETKPQIPLVDTEDDQDDAQAVELAAAE